MNLLDELQHVITSLEAEGYAQDLARSCLRGIELLRQITYKEDLFVGFIQAYPSSEDGVETIEAWFHGLSKAIRQALRGDRVLVLKTMHLVHGLREFFPFTETTTLLDVEQHLLQSYNVSIYEYISWSTEELLPDTPVRLDFYPGVPNEDVELRPLDPETLVSTLPDADTDGLYWWPHAKQSHSTPQYPNFRSRYVDEAVFSTLTGSRLLVLDSPSLYVSRSLDDDRFSPLRVGRLTRTLGSMLDVDYSSVGVSRWGYSTGEYRYSSPQARLKSFAEENLASRSSLLVWINTTDSTLSQVQHELRNALHHVSDQAGRDGGSIMRRLAMLDSLQKVLAQGYSQLEMDRYASNAPLPNSANGNVSLNGTDRLTTPALSSGMADLSNFLRSAHDEDVGCSIMSALSLLERFADLLQDNAVLVSHPQLVVRESIRKSIALVDELIISLPTMRRYVVEYRLYMFYKSLTEQGMLVPWNTLETAWVVDVAFHINIASPWFQPWPRLEPEKHRHAQKGGRYPPPVRSKWQEPYRFERISRKHRRNR